jgi:DNA-binding GntR family transcriptional regulator
VPAKQKSRRKAAAAPRTTVKADNGSSVTRAFQALRELIVRGNLPPGAWIIEAEVAERLSLSRTPIRGALQWLHREGYVVEHKGALLSEVRQRVAGRLLRSPIEGGVCNCLRVFVVPVRRGF